MNVRSSTGTGQTLAFLLPLEDLIRERAEAGDDKDFQAIILELATQVKTQIDKFTSLKSTLVYGGDGRASDQSK